MNVDGIDRARGVGLPLKERRQNAAREDGLVVRVEERHGPLRPPR